MIIPVRLGTLEISRIYNNLWCLERASVPPFIAGIFETNFYMRSQSKDLMQKKPSLSNDKLTEKNLFSSLY